MPQTAFLAARVAELEQRVDDLLDERSAARAEGAMLKAMLEETTRRRQTEQQLQQVSEWLHLAQEAGRVAAYTFDFGSERLEWSPSTLALYGFAPGQEPTIERWLDSIHPDDRERVAEVATAALEGGNEVNHRFRIIRPDGTVAWVQDRGRIVRKSDGSPDRLVGINVDVTELVELQQRNAGLVEKALEQPPLDVALAESETRFRTVANSIPALLFVAASDGANTFVNERYPEYSGLTSQELLGDGWVRTIHPDDRRRAQELWEASRSQGAEYAAEYRFRRADGAFRWHLVRGSPVHDPDGRVTQWIGTATDIQDLVEIREELAGGRVELQQANALLETRVAERTASLARANERLQSEIKRREAAQAALVQSQKLEALGQLTSGVAHDFNNVIAAIAGGYAVISRRTDDPRILAVAEHGVKAAERGAQLVKQLSSFARQQALAPVPTDLAKLLEQAQPLLARSVGPGIRLQFECADDFPAVMVDPVMLETALINLAVNARDAMVGGGTLHIAVRESPLDEPQRPAEIVGRNAAAIVVADDGCGMPTHVLQRVVEPFFTTKGPGRGTGLGLAMVHGFASQSGGGLRIESREDVGTTITLFLPLAKASADVALEREPDADLPAPRAATILLVDDDPEVRAVTAAQVSDLGYEVVEADGGDSALALFHRRPDAFDLILCDVLMPGRDGPSLVAELRKWRPGFPAVFISGHTEQLCLDDEVLLAKPFTAASLSRVIADHLPKLLSRTDEDAHFDRLAARFKSGCLQSFFADWRAARVALQLPHFSIFDPSSCEEPHKLVMAEAEAGCVPMRIRFTHIGDHLSSRAGAPQPGTEFADWNSGPLANWESAYRRCARTMRPVYEFARLNVGEGQVETFERLLLPWTSDSRGADRIVGIILF